MNAPHILGQKRSRRAALVRHGLYPLQNHPFLNRHVKLVQSAFKVPYVAVTMPSDNQEDISIAAQAGGDPKIHSVPRYKSLCSHAMLQDDVFVVEDLLQDWRFKVSPSATGAGFEAVEDGVMFRFYASVPVKLSLPAQDPRFPDEHINVGRLMIMDHKARKLDDDEIFMLNDVSYMISEAFDNAYRQHLGEKTARMSQSLGHMALSVDNPKLLRKFQKMPNADGVISSTSEGSEMDEETEAFQRTRLVCQSLRTTLNAQTAFAIDVRELDMDAPKPRSRNYRKKRRANFPRASWSQSTTSPVDSPGPGSPSSSFRPSISTTSLFTSTPSLTTDASSTIPLSDTSSSPKPTPATTASNDSPRVSRAYIPDTVSYGPDMSRVKLGHAYGTGGAGQSGAGSGAQGRAHLLAFEGPSEDLIPDVTTDEAVRDLKELLSLAQESHNPGQAHFWANLSDGTQSNCPTDSEPEPSTTGSASKSYVSDSYESSSEFSPLASIVAKDTRMYATVPVMSASRTKIRKVLVITFTSLQALDPSDLLFLHAAANILHASITRHEAAAAEQAQLAFIQTVQHELRTPLHGILGVAEDLRHALQNKTVTTEADKHCLSSNEYLDRSLEVIELAGSSLTRLLDDVLDFGQVTGVKSASDPVNQAGTVDKDEELKTLVIADWVEDLTRNVYAYEQTMRRVKSGQLAESRAAPSRGMPDCVIELSDEVQSWSWITRTTSLTKVVSRIVGNAFRFTEAGDIELRVDAMEGEGNEDRLLFTISDTGKGMSEDFVRHQLFRPFTKGSSFTPGAGLGMTLVALLAQEMNAQLHVSSVAGEGTQVSLKVPAQRITPCGLAAEVEDIDLNIGDTEAGTSGSTSSPLTLSFFIQPSPKKALIQFVNQNLLKAGLIPAPCMSRADLVVMDSVDTASYDLVNIDLKPQTQIALLGVSGMRLPSTAKFVGHSMHVMRPPYGPREVKRLLEFVRNPGSKVLHDISSILRDLDIVSVASSSETSVAPSNKKLDPQVAIPTSIGVVAAGIPAGLKTIPPVPPPVVLLQAAKLSIDDFKVLIVEDNPINARLLSTIVKRLGFQYAEAADGAEAVKMYTDFKPVVVLLDISLPVQDGFEACKQIRESAARLGLAPLVVAITALSSEQDQQRGLNECGMDLWRTKPVSPRSLSTELQAWFERWKAYPQPMSEQPSAPSLEADSNDVRTKPNRGSGHCPGMLPSHSAPWL